MNPVQTGDFLTSGEITATFANGMGNASNINDGNDATSSATTQTIGTTQSYVIATYEFTAQPIGFIDVRNVALQGGSATDSVNLVIEVNLGGSWTNIYNKNITQTPQNLRVYANQNTDKARIRLNNVSPNIQSSKFNCSSKRF